MALINISNVQEISKASFAELYNISFNEYLEIIKPLMFFIVGITIYSLFIFKFYRFIAKKDILKLNLSRYSKEYMGFIKLAFKMFYYVLENLIIIPLLIFFWFTIMAIILLIISKSSTPNHVLLISVSLVAAVRITSYYNEQLSQDLAKMIPFALLGVYLVNVSFFSIQESIEMAKQIPSLWKIGIYYLLFVTLLEFILRIISGIINIFYDPQRFEEED